MRLILSFLLLLSALALFAQPCKEVVGYYPAWQWYDRAKLVKPAGIRYDRYTIINYAFFQPMPDGSITGTDAWADENLLLGEPDWANGGYLPNTSIVDLAHSAGVKVVISVGGWTLSNDFPAIAADPVKRTNFAHHCAQLIRQYNLDGVDLDWEYPGFPDHNGTPADRANFTLLLSEVRDSIDATGNTLGRNMLLTAAVGAGADRMDDVDWPAVTSLLDIINLMSYDFFGAWDATTNHNAPLYAPNVGDVTFNCDSAITRLIQVYGVDPGRITLGVPFYGRSAVTTGAPGLFVPSTQTADNITFFTDDGSPLYYNILLNLSSFDTWWDNQAQVPYLTGRNGLNTFVSYDDEQSIARKAQYINDHNLRGAIIWEITGDYLETSPGSGIIAATPLADTLNAVLCSSTGLSGVSGVDEWQLYPSPAIDRVHVRGAAQDQIISASMLTAYGQFVDVMVRERKEEIVFDVRSLPAGLYLVELRCKDGARRVLRFPVAR
ncbi:MAG: glycosyl hydrolase family 18 protein [Bacteroidota bacterium]|uniref:glycosyl hydrolase family 18 protein n=1 Tax=Candidatus Pollutiaquabacter sp. TaxID=3416354 RepID=UPI001B4860ED|nr:hypothetical protein [Bacteroidota bacterium]MBP7269955.1 hypothetical protein [Bacteroidia bacterium]MBP7728248.1 hypothetical protein [Bacteroidia bacterium]MBP7772553.1 hypothetical protein [Bacteroidia bacterium]